MIDLSSIRRAAQDGQKAMALNLAQEWQAVIAALLADVLLSATTEATIELKNKDIHPYFAGKLALLRYMGELADADVVRFQDDKAAGLLSILRCARAWADAIERVDGIAAAEERLREAVRGYEQHAAAQPNDDEPCEAARLPQTANRSRRSAAHGLHTTRDD
jgi:hypothetical protein